MNPSASPIEKFRLAKGAESRSDRLKISYLACAVLFSLILSAVVNLQLFQDGSSYLFEIIVSGPAVRHQRVSVLLIQAPTVLAEKVLTKMQVDPVTKVEALRLLFSFSYAVIPLISLGLCWLVVRGKHEGLFIWAALIILFINCVNFSWVSELLMALQLSCSLLLAAIVLPGTRTFWYLTILLLPVVFLLHPLVAPVFFTIGAGSAYISYKRPQVRGAARCGAIIFLTAALLRVLFSLQQLSPYERSFLESSKMHEYLVMTGPQNAIFLLTGLVIGLLCLLTKSSTRFLRVGIIFFPYLVALPVLGGIVFLPDDYALGGLIRLAMVLGCVGLVAVFDYGYFRDKTVPSQLRWIYLSCMALAGIGGILLLGQYFSDSGQFVLKTGLALFTVMLVMTMAVFDSLAEISPSERLERFNLVAMLVIVFAVVVGVKSLIWQSAVHKLEQTLSLSKNVCTEIGSNDYTWLEETPYRIINKWSLPSLALLLQDKDPRKLLVTENGCRLFYESSLVQINPWTRIPRKAVRSLLN